METFTLYRRLHRTAAGRRLFGRLYGHRVPYFAPLHLRVEHMGPHRAEVLLPLRKGVTNHLGTLHALAVCNGLEAAMGLLAEATTPATHRWIPVGMEVAYPARATSDLECVAVTEPGQWPTGADETREVKVGVASARDDGTVVVTGSITIRVSPRR